MRSLPLAAGWLTGVWKCKGLRPRFETIVQTRVSSPIGLLKFDMDLEICPLPY